MFGHAKETDVCDAVQSWQTGIVRHITPGGAVRVELDTREQALVPYHYIGYIVDEWLPDGVRPEGPRS